MEEPRRRIIKAMEEASRPDGRDTSSDISSSVARRRIVKAMGKIPKRIKAMEENRRRIKAMEEN